MSTNHRIHPEKPQPGALKPIEIRTHDRLRRIASTAVDLSSPSIETASFASSMTLVDRSRDASPITNQSYEDLIPKPLSYHKRGRYYSTGNAPPTCSQLTNKALPALPRCEDHPAWRQNGAQGEPAKAKPSRRRTMPEKPQPKDLEALNEAFARKGFTPDVKHDSAVCPIYLDLPELNSEPKEALSKITPRHVEVSPEETSKDFVQLPLQKEAAFPESSGVQPPQMSPSKTKSHKRHTISTLTRAFSRLLPSKLLSRQLSQPPSATTAASTATSVKAMQDIAISPTISASSTIPSHPERSLRILIPEPSMPQPVRSPRSAGQAPPSPVARMKRALSILMDERFSINLSRLSCVGEVDVLLQRTRVLLADQPRPSRSPIQEVEGCSPTSLKPTFNLIRRSHELGDASQIINRRPTLLSTMFRHIMHKINDLPDLFALALVNKASYTAFKAAELTLIKSTLRKLSPPAWELRQMKELQWEITTPGAQSLAAGLYLRHYTWDLMQITQIKFLLQDHCEPLLSKDLIIGLRNPLDPRSSRVDSAIWRVWTFTHLFGNRKDREHDYKGQERWLRGQSTGSKFPTVCRFSPDPADFNTVLFAPPEGFAMGNPSGGLRRWQLLDMVDVWIALGALLDFLRGRVGLARRCGVFGDGTEGMERGATGSREEVKLLRSWLDFILTLGPAAVLELAPSGPNSNPEVAFNRARLNGWTEWTPPSPKAPKSNFLIGIVRSILRTMPEQDSESDPKGV